MNEIQTIHIVIIMCVLFAFIIGGFIMIRITSNKDECKHKNIKTLKYEPNCYIIHECQDCKKKFFNDLQNK